MVCRPDAVGVGDRIAVTIGRSAADVRRAVGPTTWCAFEVLAATPADSGAPWTVRCTVREVAAHLGVAPTTAQRALRLLRDDSFVTAIQDREHGGRFASTACRLAVDPSVLCRSLLAPQPRVASRRAVALGEQLVLLPSA